MNLNQYFQEYLADPVPLGEAALVLLLNVQTVIEKSAVEETLEVALEVASEVDLEVSLEVASEVALEVLEVILISNYIRFLNLKISTPFKTLKHSD